VGPAYVRTPWGAPALDFAGRTALAIADSPLTGLNTFTVELWARFDDLLAGPQVLLEHVGGGSDYWRLMLDRWGRLTLFWLECTPPAGARGAVADRATGASGGDGPDGYKFSGELRVCQAVQMADVVQEGRWYHLALFNSALNYLEVSLTPVGELFPRTLRVKRFTPRAWRGSAPGRLVVGGAEQGGEFFRGALCDLAVFPHLKRKNEFPALGQRPPRNFTMAADFPLSSALLPVERGPNQVTVGCRPAPYQQKSFWFYSRLEGVRGKEIEMEILPWPDSTAMLASPWVSYDRRTWEHVRSAHWFYEPPAREAMIFRHKFSRSPAYVAVSLPYGLAEIDRLQQDVRGSDFVRCVVASRSTEGRPIRLFYCTDPSVPDKHKQAIYMQAGQHTPGEMLGGVAMDAAIRACARPAAQLRGLLRKAILLFVPVVNQDTAYHGGSSSVACGVNLNRDWWQPRSPEVMGLKAYITRIHRKVAPIRMAVDFHGGGGWRAHTVLCRWKNVNDQYFPGCHAAQERWLAALERHCDFAPREFVRETRSHLGNTVAQGICTTALPCQLHIPAVTPELSGVLYWDRRRGRYRRLTQKAMQRMGPELLRACAEFLGGE